MIRFLIANAYSVGGTIRATFATASQLARNHEVEVVSVYRFADECRLEHDPHVRVRTLTDLRTASLGRAEKRVIRHPTRLIHRDDVRHPRFNLLTDAALLRFLWSVRDGVLVGTRPGLNLVIARYARTRVVRVGQDHMNLEGYRPDLLRAIARSYPRLDAVTALTEGTAAGFRALIGPGTRVLCIPNPAPRDPGRRARLDSRVVIAAGSLTHRKGFDRLLKAWAQVVPSHRDWTLEIFGSGPIRRELEALIEELGIARSARLRGHSPSLLQELARASVFAMTSRQEGFPMVILEAMCVGLPVVAYDCPTGPRDVVTDGVDGYVVPDGRTRLLAEALGGLMTDADRRRRFGAAALEKAARYRSDALGARWEGLFDELAASKRGRLRGRWRDDATARARA